MKVKTCSKCGQSKPPTLDYWHKDKHKHDNLSTICKSCRQAFDRIRDPLRNKDPHRRLSLRVSRQNRRASNEGVRGRLTCSDILNQYALQKGLCYWCKTPLRGHYDIDHIRPLSKGGNNTPGNVVCSCRHCNTRKSDKKPYVWLGVLASQGICHPDKPDTIPVQLPLFDQR